MRLPHTLVITILLVCCPSAAPQWLTNTFISLVRENVAGIPLVHDRQSWHFHPDEGLVRRQRYQQLYGPRGEWLIKALGEGEGGFPKLGTEEGGPYIENDKKRTVLANAASKQVVQVNSEIQNQKIPQQGLGGNFVNTGFPVQNVPQKIFNSNVVPTQTYAGVQLVNNGFPVQNHGFVGTPQEGDFGAKILSPGAPFHSAKILNSGSQIHQNQQPPVSPTQQVYTGAQEVNSVLQNGNSGAQQGFTAPQFQQGFTPVLIQQSISQQIYPPVAQNSGVTPQQGFTQPSNQAGYHGFNNRPIQVV